MDAFLSQEPIVRMGAFLSVFVLMALWEMLAPRRECRVGFQRSAGIAPGFCNNRKPTKGPAWSRAAPSRLAY